MSTILVAYASKMGGTREIAEVVGAELLAAGHRVDVSDAGEVRDVSRYDVVVVGSALYMGRWRGEAVRLLKRHAGALAGRQVWLFHSGPCGEGAGDPVEPPRNVARLAAAIGAAGPITFGGRLEPATATGWLAKRMAAGPLAGDFRDWDRVREWARTVAAERTGQNRTGQDRTGQSR